MLTMYKTIEPPVGRLHRLYWTLASIEKGKVLRKSKVPNRNSKRNGEN